MKRAFDRCATCSQLRVTQPYHPNSSVRVRHKVSILATPEPQLTMFRQMQEVLIRGQKRQVVANAEPSQQRIDGSDLHASFTTGVAEIGCRNVILAIRHQQRKRRKAVHDLIAGLRTGERLKQLLKHKACRDDA